MHRARREARVLPEAAGKISGSWDVRRAGQRRRRQGSVGARTASSSLPCRCVFWTLAAAAGAARPTWQEPARRHGRYARRLRKQSTRGPAQTTRPPASAVPLYCPASSRAVWRQPYTTRSPTRPGVVLPQPAARPSPHCGQSPPAGAATTVHVASSCRSLVVSLVVCLSCPASRCMLLTSPLSRRPRRCQSPAASKRTGRAPTGGLILTGTHTLAHNIVVSIHHTHTTPVPVAMCESPELQRLLPRPTACLARRHLRHARYCVSARHLRRRD